jgi:hypothetical protein
MSELLQGYRQRDALSRLTGMDHNPFLTEGELAADGRVIDDHSNRAAAICRGPVGRVALLAPRRKWCDNACQMQASRARSQPGHGGVCNCFVTCIVYGTNVATVQRRGGHDVVYR